MVEQRDKCLRVAGELLAEGKSVAVGEPESPSHLTVDTDRF